MTAQQAVPATDLGLQMASSSRDAMLSRWGKERRCFFPVPAISEAMMSRLFTPARSGPTQFPTALSSRP